MDSYANKTKIKITKNALTGKELLLLYDKHSDQITGVNIKNDLNTKFYSTDTTKTPNITKTKFNTN